MTAAEVEVTTQSGARFLIRKDADGVHVVRTVTHARGSWKWQDAFHTSYYGVRYSQRSKKHVFELMETSRKFALSRGRTATGGLGGLQHKTVPAEVLQAIGLLEGA